LHVLPELGPLGGDEFADALALVPSTEFDALQDEVLTGMAGIRSSYRHRSEWPPRLRVVFHVLTQSRIDEPDEPPVG
jgi:hypothetical protein